MATVRGKGEEQEEMSCFHAIGLHNESLIIHASLETNTRGKRGRYIRHPSLGLIYCSWFDRSRSV